MCDTCQKMGINYLDLLDLVSKDSPFNDYIDDTETIVEIDENPK